MTPRKVRWESTVTQVLIVESQETGTRKGKVGRLVIC